VNGKPMRPTSACADREPQVDLAGRQIDRVGTPEERFKQAPVRADIVGSDRCAADGFTAGGVLALCRSLTAAGFDPARPLHAYRDGVLCLVVRSLEEGAALTVAEGDRGIPRFRRWKPFRLREGSPSIAPPGEGARALGGRR
jgi:hypothetical protein